MSHKFESKRSWAYRDQEGEVVKTEQEIIDEYFPYWSQTMTRVGKEHFISYSTCVEDWIVVHWAYEVTQ